MKYLEVITMKKRIMTAAVLSLALLAGCGGKDSDTINKEAPTVVADNDDPGNKVTPTEEADMTEPTAGPIAEPTEETRPVTLFAGYESSEAEILSFLEGEWVLHETDNMIEPPDMLFDTLTFDSEKLEVTYRMAYAAEEAVYSFSLSDLYPDVPGQYNKLTLQETATTPDYPYSDGNKQIELSIRLASNGGYDALVIGDVDDTPSHFIKDALGEDRKAGDYWYFHRNYDDMPGVIRTESFDESAAVRKNSHFYALQYDELGSE